MTGRYDLHVHTSCSDGLESPRDVVDHAVRAGLSVLSITDHDTLEGYLEAYGYLKSCGRLADSRKPLAATGTAIGETAADEATAAADDSSRSMVLIPGIEVSTRTGERDVHILGYYLEQLPLDLSAALVETRERREQRSLGIVDRLADAGYPLTRDDLTRDGHTVNRTSIARILVKRGVVSSVSEAFDTLIGRGAPFHIERDEIDTASAVRMIADGGGIAVIAHPALYHVVDLIEPLMDSGLSGVEAYHGEQTLQQAEQLAELAGRLGLLVTGGSDWHQDAVHPAGLGGTELPLRYLEEFLAADPR